MANSNNSRYRVSLKFSEKDKEQEEVVTLLKQMGRRKSAFITKAVKYYLSENPEPEIPNVTSVSINKSSLRTTMKKILSEMTIDELTELINKKENPLNKKEEVFESKPKQNEAVKPKIEEIKQEEVSDDEVDSFLAGLEAWDLSDF